MSEPVSHPPRAALPALPTHGLRSGLAGHDLRRQPDKLQADIFHVGMVLRLYGEDPQDIPTKDRVPVRLAFFGCNEITRRCYDLLREK